MIIDEPVKYCNQCLFAGGKYYPDGPISLDPSNLEGTTGVVACVFDKTKFTDLTIPAFVNYHMNYEELFDGL